MGIDIIIRDTPIDKLYKIYELFKDQCYWLDRAKRALLIKQTPNFNDTTTYSNLSEDDLATLEFLPDFDTRYTYLLSLSLGINA